MNVDAAHSLWQAIGGARGDSLEATAEKFKQIESLSSDVVRGLVERLGFSPERSHKGNVEKLRRSLTNLRLNQQRADSIAGTAAAP